MEGAVDEGDRGAVLLADMTADRAVAVDVEPAMAFGSLRQAALRFQHDVVRMNDEEHFAPGRHLSPDVGEGFPCGRDRGTLGEDVEDLGRGYLGGGGNRLDDAVGLCGKGCKCALTAIAVGLNSKAHDTLTRHRRCGRPCGLHG